jgi:hypothetical protein
MGGEGRRIAGVSREWPFSNATCSETGRQKTSFGATPGPAISEQSTSVSSDRSEIVRGDWTPLELLFAGA